MSSDSTVTYLAGESELDKLYPELSKGTQAARVVLFVAAASFPVLLGVAAIIDLMGKPAPLQISNSVVEPTGLMSRLITRTNIPAAPGLPTYVQNDDLKPSHGEHYAHYRDRIRFAGWNPSVTRPSEDVCEPNTPCRKFPELVACADTTTDGYRCVFEWWSGSKKLIATTRGVDFVLDVVSIER